MVPLDPHGRVGRGCETTLEVGQLVLHQAQVGRLRHELGRLTLKHESTTEQSVRTRQYGVAVRNS